MDGVTIGLSAELKLLLTFQKLSLTDQARVMLLVDLLSGQTKFAESTEPFPDSLKGS